MSVVRPKLSIIIPTRNRYASLSDTLNSLTGVCNGLRSEIECIVVDNGSTDKTKDCVDSFASSGSFAVQYVYEPCPGLHVGRNLGAQLAKGEILAYLDDDVIVKEGWAEAVIQNFAANPRLALLGGPCSPYWETNPQPHWLERLRQDAEGGWLLWELSLIELAPELHQVSSDYIFGCNYCIKREIVLESGGFHPDGMPAELLQFRGDGETALAADIVRCGLEVWYDPKVAVLHRVPCERITAQYVARIYSRNGVGTAYSFFRSNHGSYSSLLRHFVRQTIGFLKLVLRTVSGVALGYPYLPYFFQMHAHFSMLRQLARLMLSKELRHWTRQRSYFKHDPCPYWKK
jgi:glycosyltransferase involved in cell wall biosynthesis